MMGAEVALMIRTEVGLKMLALRLGSKDGHRGWVETADFCYNYTHN